MRVPSPKKFMKDERKKALAQARTSGRRYGITQVLNARQFMQTKLRGEELDVFARQDMQNRQQRALDELKGTSDRALRAGIPGKKIDKAVSKGTADMFNAYMGPPPKWGKKLLKGNIKGAAKAYMKDQKKRRKF